MCVNVTKIISRKTYAHFCFPSIYFCIKTVIYQLVRCSCGFYRWDPVSCSQCACLSVCFCMFELFVVFVRLFVCFGSKNCLSFVVFRCFNFLFCLLVLFVCLFVWLIVCLFACLFVFLFLPLYVVLFYSIVDYSFVNFIFAFIPALCVCLYLCCVCPSTFNLLSLLFESAVISYIYKTLRTL